jgi:serine/threonine protein kinase
MHTSEQRPVFNDTYHIIKSLGEGNTSKVYLGRQIAAPHAWVAIKVMKEEFLTRDKDSILAVQNEITILKHMQHFNIVQMYDYGNTGSVLKPSGRVIPNLVFIVMEYVAGGLLFDLCQLMQNMGEDVGRFFAI